MPRTPPKSGRMRFYLCFSEPLIDCQTFIDASRHCQKYGFEVRPGTNFCYGL